jgi:preprotein translocase subunit SecG
LRNQRKALRNKINQRYQSGKDMENINSILLVAQVLLSISQIVLILMQHGKGADAGAAFGSGASATVFGARGSGNFLSKSTAIIAMLFFAVCLSLAYVSSNRVAPDSVTGSVITKQNDTSTMMESSELPPAESGSETAVETDLPPAN